LGEVSRYNAKIQSKGALRREKPSAENSPPLSRDQVQFISGRATAVNLFPVNYHTWFVGGFG